MSFGSTIDSLIHEGTCVLLHCYKSGTAYDWSKTGNTGVLSANCTFNGPAGSLRFPATTDEVTVADHASLRLTAGSIVAVSEPGFTSQSNFQAIWARAAGTVHNFVINSSGLAFYDGATNRTIAMAVVGAHSIGITFAAGGTPIGYREGISAGAFSGSVNPGVLSAPTTLGGYANLYPLKSPLSALIIANRILTPTEMASVHAELLALRWPSKQYSHGLARQGSRIGEANLLAGFSLKPQGGEVFSHDGAYTGTLSGEANYRNSILGPALAMGRTTGAVDLGVGNAQIDPTTDSHWVEVWARPLDVAMSDTKVPIIGKGVSPGGWGAYVNFGVWQIAAGLQLIWRNTVGAYPTVAGPVGINKLTHILYQVDRVSNNAYLYIDGIQYGPTAITGVLAAEATNWKVGKCGSSDANFDEGFGGLAANPRIGTGVLTPAQVQARYLEGARAVQFKTDWGYPISAANEGGTLHQQIGGFASPFRAGDTTGRWAVETDTIQGKLCKVLTCKTSGRVYIDQAHFYDCTSTEAAYGTFEWWIYHADLADTYVIFNASSTGNELSADQNGYDMRILSNERLALREISAGIGSYLFYTSGSYFPVTTWTKIRVTRTGAGIFTMYMNDTIVGSIDSGSNPATDTTHTTSKYLVFDLDAGDAISLSPHPIIKMLGEVAP